MLTTILVPLDGSPLAERALSYASVLARRSRASLVLIEAVAAHGDPDRDVPKAETYVQTMAARLTADGRSAHGYVYHDEPVHSILDAAGFHRADLIVMSTHGRGGLGRMLYGSVADQILRRATTPVLLVPSIVQHAWPAEGPLSMLVPLDGSALAEEALESAGILTEVFGSKLTLLRVVQPPAYPLYGEGYAYVPFDEQAEAVAAWKYLEEQSARLGAGGEPIQTEVAVGDPSHVVGEMARVLDVDVVVMATHGNGGLTRLILGSVASATLRHTTAPLLLVRPSSMPSGEVATPQLPASAPGAARPPSGIDAEVPLFTVHVSLTDIELELVTRGLKALAYAPEYDYGHVQAARALADRLMAEAQSHTRQPLVTR